MMGPTTEALDRPTDELGSSNKAPLAAGDDIQPFGLVIATDNTDGKPRITHISANAAYWLGIPATSAIGGSLSTILGTELARSVEGCLPCETPGYCYQQGLLPHKDGGATSVGIVVHDQAPRTLVTLEPSCRDRSADLVRQQAESLHRMAVCEDAQSLLRCAAAEMALITGYDRVLIYRFDEDGNGKVLVERTDGRPARFEGQYLPQTFVEPRHDVTDEPEPLRLIADTEAPSVSIIASEPLNLDLSGCLARAGSAGHCRALRQLGVRSSLSLTLVLGGQAWGVMTCHAETPRRPSQPARQIGEAIANQAALYLERLHREDDDREAHALKQRLDELRERINAGARLEDCLRDCDHWLRETFSCDSLAIRIAGHSTVLGRNPGEAVEAAIVARALEAASEGIAASYEVADGHSDGNWVASYLYIALSQDGTDYCLWLRSQRPHTIVWATPSPPDPIAALPGRQQLGTRQQVIAGRPAPWRDPEIQAGLMLRDMLQMHLAGEYYALRQRQPALARVAWHDSLTGLPNRHTLLQELASEVANGTHRATDVVCLFLDLDGFKPINDHHGHRTGDAVLRTIAERLTQAVRDTDRVGRLGGDEFVVVSRIRRGSWSTASEQLAERFAEATREPIPVNGHTHRLSCSIGIAVLGEHGDDTESLLQAADAAMYAAKHNGVPYRVAEMANDVSLPPSSIEAYDPQ